MMNAVFGATSLAIKKAIFVVSKTSTSNLRTNNRLVGAFFSSASRYSQPGVSRYSESEGGMVSESKDPVHGTTTTGMPAADKRWQEQQRREGGGGVSGFVAEKAKEGSKKAAETVVEVGDKAKEAADEAWGAAKETTRTIKEAVAGDGDENKPPHHGATDSHVEDLRKHAGGYDLRKD